MSDAPEKRTRGPSPVPVLLLVLAGLAVAVAAATFSREMLTRMEQDRAYAAFVEDARSRIAAVEERLGRATDALYSLRSLFRSSEAVTQQEFLVFAEETLERHSEVAAFEWTPRVDRSFRSDFENSMRSAYPEFRITRLAAPYRFTTAGTRETYYPIQYLAPVTGNERMIGFDLASDPERRRALAAAQRHKGLAASGRIELMQHAEGPGPRYGIFLALPVFAEQYRHAWMSGPGNPVAGYLGQVLHIGELARHALAGLEPGDLELWIQDVSAGPGDRFLYHYEGTEGPGNWMDSAEPPDGPFVLQRDFLLADRQWRFTATADRTPAGPDPWLPELLFGATVLLTFAAAAWLHLRRKSAFQLAETARELRQEVIQRQDTEARLHRMNRAHSVLSTSNKALVHAEPETDVHDLFCRNLVRHGGYSLAWAGGHAPDGRIDIRAAAASSGKIEYALLEQLAAPGGPEWCSLTRRRQFLVEEWQDWPDAEWRNAMERGSLTAALALPVLGDEAEVLVIYAASPAAFDADERQLLADLADDLSYAVRARHADRRERTIAAELRLRERALEASHNGILIVRNEPPDYTISYANPALAALAGLTLDQLTGNPGWSLFQPDNLQEREKIATALRQGKPANALLHNRRPDGSEYWAELQVSPVPEEDHRVRHYVWVFNDVTEHRRYETQLEHQANYDPLTGLPNRNLLLDRLEQALGYGRRHGRDVAVLFIDLDDFKLINDSIGHRQGDRTLVVLAERLRAVVANGETLARYGGDEFVIVLPDLADSEQAAETAASVVGMVSQPLMLSGHRFQLSCSIGIGLFPKDGADADELMRNADTAMYKAKETGRNRWHFYTPELNARVLERVTVEARLRTALNRGELRLEYQPQADLQSGEITGMEALVRWEHPEAGLVYPAQFIPVAEASGLIVPLGEWVIEASCRQVAAWRAQGTRVPLVAVNVSADQLYAADFVPRLSELLERYHIEPRLFELELTESGLMQRVDQMARALERLKAIGVQVAIDDFGTGYSSLAKLQRFSFDKLKVDESFVRHLTTNPDDATIANAIIAMGRSLRLRVLAEGVTSEEQARYLKDHGCDEIQGFWFSEPLRPEAMGQLLREGRRLVLALH